MAQPKRRRQIAGMIGTAEDALAVMNPLVSSYDGGSDGSDLGIEIGTGRPYDFNPDDLMQDGRIGSKQFAIFGSVGSRKTTLGKSLALNQASISHGGRRPRIGIDDINRRNGIPEWTSFGEAFQSKPLSGDQSINQFDPTFGFTFSEDLESANDLFTSANNGEKIVGDQELVMQVVLSKMRHEFADIASLDTLDWIVSRYHHSFYDEYMENEGIQFKKNVTAEVKDQALQARIDALNEANPIYLEEAMERAAFDVHERLLRIKEGDFGKAFGGAAGTSPTADILRQRAVIKDYTNQNDNIIMAKQKFFWRLKRSAIQRKDTRFMTQIEVHDENYKMWRYLEYAESQSDNMKQLRNANEELILISHRPRDYTTVGPVGSRQYQLATNMLSEIEVMFIGMLKKRDVDELKEFIDIDKKEASMIRNQGRGQFCVKIRNEPIVAIDTGVNYTGILRQVSQSNGALDESLKRNKVVDEEFYEFPEEENDEAQASSYAS